MFPPRLKVCATQSHLPRGNLLPASLIPCPSNPLPGRPASPQQLSRDPGVIMFSGRRKRLEVQGTFLRVHRVVRFLSHLLSFFLCVHVCVSLHTHVPTCEYEPAYISFGWTICKYITDIMTPHSHILQWESLRNKGILLHDLSTSIPSNTVCIQI